MLGLWLAAFGLVSLPVSSTRWTGPAKYQFGFSTDWSVIAGRIPEEQREVVVLHRYQGFSYADIAEMTDSSEAGVKQKAYRGLKRLKEIVQEMDS